MPFEKIIKIKNPPGYLGKYPYPAHIDLEERNEAIRELRQRPQKVRLKRQILFFIGSHFIHWVVLWIYRLSRQVFTIHPETEKLIKDPKAQFIVAIWHNRLFYSVYSLRYKVAQYGHDILAIISESDDAEYIARCTEYCGAYSARGSSTRGGKKALKKILRYVNLHFHPLITPDGPLGPMYEAKDGLAAIARLTGLPIVPVAYDTNSKWVFNSWDKFIIPKPMAKVYLDYGSPIFLDDSLSVEQATIKIQDMMLKQIEFLNLRIRIGTGPKDRDRLR